MKQNKPQYGHKNYGQGDKQKKAKPVGYRYKNVDKESKLYYKTPSDSLIKKFEKGDEDARNKIYFERRKDHSDVVGRRMRNGGHIRFTIGDRVIVNTGGVDTRGVIWDKNGRSSHGFYWESQDSYLVKFENGTSQYIPSKYIKSENYKEFGSMATGGGVRSPNKDSRSLVQSRTDFNANNLSGENIGDTYVVKSYGYYPVFVYKNGKWYENSNKYSKSTAKQMGQVRPTSETELVSTDELKAMYQFEDGGSITSELQSIENTIHNNLSSGDKVSVELVTMYLGRKPRHEENIVGYTIRKCYLQPYFKRTAKRAYLDETLKRFNNGGELDSKEQELKEKIEAILKKVVPNFYHKVWVYNNFFGEGKSFGILISASDYLINNVEGQYPQVVSLSLNLKTLELQPQVFGGNGGQSIYREPNMDDPKEKYLAMKSIKIPFRTPNKNEESVLKAIEKFAENYKKAIKENIDVLKYRDIVDYNSLINDKYSNGGGVNSSGHIHSGRYLDIDKNENGNLKITINDEAREKIQEMREEDHCDDCIMSDLFDDIRGNSELMYFGDAGEMGFGLNSAPCITDGYYFDDNGHLTEEGHDDAQVYYYEPYMVKSFVDEMIANGHIIFNCAGKMKVGGRIVDASKKILKHNILEAIRNDREVSVESLTLYLGRKPQYEENIDGMNVRKCFLRPFYKSI